MVMEIKWKIADKGKGIEVDIEGIITGTTRKKGQYWRVVEVRE